MKSTLQGIFRKKNLSIFFSLAEYLMIAGEADRTCLGHQAVWAETLKQDMKIWTTDVGSILHFWLVDKYTW